MGDKESIFSNNLFSADIETRTIFSVMFKLFYLSENYNTIYKNDIDNYIAKNLIELYYEKVNPNYDNMISSFRKKYISTESLVEKNDTVDQKKGVALVYDYIQGYNKETENFNILVESLQINLKLWHFRDQSFADQFVYERRKKLEDKLKEAKAEKNLVLYKQVLKDIKDINCEMSNVKIGGQLRSGLDRVDMVGLDFDVPLGEESMKFINSFSSEEKRKEFSEKLNSSNIIEYIDYCVKITTDLIKYQPFRDGNKRTFRGLLNLMFKLKKIPPIYIRLDEREKYKEALYKAILFNNYDDIKGFYYYKICDSIYELDIDPIYRAKIKKLEN